MRFVAILCLLLWTACLEEQRPAKGAIKKASDTSESDTPPPPSPPPPPRPVVPPVVVPPVVVPPIVPPVVVAPIAPIVEVPVAAAVYAYETKKNGQNTVVRLSNQGTPYTRAKLIEKLIEMTDEGFAFRTLLNKSIADLPPAGNGVQIKMPVINRATAAMDAYFVAVPDNLYGLGSLFSDYLYHCAPTPVLAKSRAFDERFLRFFALANEPLIFQERMPNDDGHMPFGAVIFKGGYGRPEPTEIMVSPCPKAARLTDPANQFLGHIYSFTKAVRDETVLENSLRLHSFWYTVGQAARRMFDGVSVRDMDGNEQQNLFLSTHGQGVAYLHFRVENIARHYRNVDSALKDNYGSDVFYRSFFAR